MINHLHWIGDGHGTSANAVCIEDVGCWSNHYLLHVKATMRLIFLCGRKSWKKIDSQKVSRNESMTSAVEMESPRKLRIEKRPTLSRTKTFLKMAPSCNQSWQWKTELKQGYVFWPAMLNEWYTQLICEETRHCNRRQFPCFLVPLSKHPIGCWGLRKHIDQLITHWFK